MQNKNCYSAPKCRTGGVSLLLCIGAEVYQYLTDGDDKIVQHRLP